MRSVSLIAFVVCFLVEPILYLRDGMPQGGIYSL